MHSPKDFDPLVHIEVQEPKAESAEDDAPKAHDGQEHEEEDSTDKDALLERQYVENINSHWLVVEPSQTDFAALLRECLLDEGLVCLRNFIRFSRHSDLQPYVNVLESWDDRVCEGEWEVPDDFFLRCDEWL